MPRKVSKFTEYADGEQYAVQAKNPDTFRANLYLYARRNDLTAKSYKDMTTLPYPTVHFRLGSGKLRGLEGAPPRGSHSHEASNA